MIENPPEYSVGTQTPSTISRPNQHVKYFSYLNNLTKFAEMNAGDNLPRLQSFRCADLRFLATSKFDGVQLEAGACHCSARLRADQLL